MAPNNRELVAQAKTIIARCNEKEGKWADAEQLYQAIMTEYADTAASLRVPLFMALHFKDGEQTEEAQKVYASALESYEKIITDTAAPDYLKKNAFDLTNVIYAQQENWEQIISNLTKRAEDPSVNADQQARALYIAGFILQTKVMDINRARTLYTQFMERYAKHPLVNAVKRQLAELEKGADAEVVSDQTGVSLQ